MASEAAGGITQVQLADLLGVSQNTVHRALNGHGGVGRATRERILAAAHEHGYRFNLAAKAMRQGRFNAVSLVMGADPKTAFLPLGLLRNLQQAAAARGLALNLAELDEARLDEPGYGSSLLRQRQSDGMILDYIKDVPPALEALARELPAVWLNVDRRTDAVRPDDEQAGHAAAAHLAALGHRRIAYVVGSRFAHCSVSDRLAGYRRWSAEAGLESRVIAVAEADGSRGLRAAVLAAIRAADRPSALVVDGQLGWCYAWALEAGLRVPEELSLIGFTVDRPDLGGLKASSLVIPQREIAEAALAMLTAKIADPGQAQPSVLVPMHPPLPGGSCAPV